MLRFHAGLLPSLCANLSAVPPSQQVLPSSVQAASVAPWSSVDRWQPLPRFGADESAPSGEQAANPPDKTNGFGVTEWLGKLKRTPSSAMTGQTVEPNPTEPEEASPACDLPENGIWQSNAAVPLHAPGDAIVPGDPRQWLSAAREMPRHDEVQLPDLGAVASDLPPVSIRQELDVLETLGKSIRTYLSQAEGADEAIATKHADFASPTLHQVMQDVLLADLDVKGWSLTGFAQATLLKGLRSEAFAEELLSKSYTTERYRIRQDLERLDQQMPLEAGLRVDQWEQFLQDPAPSLFPENALTNLLASETLQQKVVESLPDPVKQQLEIAVQADRAIADFWETASMVQQVLETNRLHPEDWARLEQAQAQPELAVWPEFLPPEYNWHQDGKALWRGIKTGHPSTTAALDTEETSSDQSLFASLQRRIRSSRQ
ncbi:MAG: hypothetical protein SFZ03_04870 [Candidatus Melainabacteria bacterium]|nr:hypothetical protein [Candidatus Melainabacteria bacterium]